MTNTVNIFQKGSQVATVLILDVDVMLMLMMMMLMMMLMVMVLLLTRRGCAKMPHSQGLFPQERLAKVNSRTDSRICMVTASTSLWFENTSKKGQKKKGICAHTMPISGGSWQSGPAAGYSNLTFDL